MSCFANEEMAFVLKIKQEMRRNDICLSVVCTWLLSDPQSACGSANDFQTMLPVGLPVLEVRLKSN